MLSGWLDVVARSIQEEGSYSNDPKDPGGETNWGISKRAFPQEDIKALTRERAIGLYYQYFWQAPGLAQLPLELGFQVFDAGINIGVKTAVMLLQGIVGVTADGQVGPTTRAAVAGWSQETFVMAFLSARVSHYTGLSTFPDFGKGWMNRCAQCLLWASGDLKRGSPLVG